MEQVEKLTLLEQASTKLLEIAPKPGEISAVLWNNKNAWTQPQTSFSRASILVHNDAMSGGSSPGSSPGRRYCVVVLIKTLYSHIASVYPGVEMGTGEFTTGGKPWGGLASHPGGIRNARSRFILQK